MKSLDYYSSFWYRFTRPIKRLWFKFLLNRDKLIKVDERHRGVGKTYIMIERAIREDIPIVVGDQQQAYLIKRDGNPVKILRLAKNFTIDFEGERFPNGVMIDESVDPTMIPFIEEKILKFVVDLLEIIGAIKQMKTKKIAIIYIPNRLDSISSAEKIFSKIVSELKDSGLKVKHSNKILTLFDNATKVEKVPFGKAMIGMRITHMYIDNNVLELEGGKRFINVTLIPCVIPSGNYANLDATEEVKERVFIFDLKGSTEKYF